jgi:hypothetical protein
MKVSVLGAEGRMYRNLCDRNGTQYLPPPPIEGWIVTKADRRRGDCAHGRNTQWRIVDPPSYRIDFRRLTSGVPSFHGVESGRDPRSRREPKSICFAWLALVRNVHLRMLCAPPDSPSVSLAGEEGPGTARKSAQRARSSGPPWTSVMSRAGCSSASACASANGSSGSGGCRDGCRFTRWPRTSAAVSR